MRGLEESGLEESGEADQLQKMSKTITHTPPWHGNSPKERVELEVLAQLALGRDAVEAGPLGVELHRGGIEFPKGSVHRTAMGHKG